MRVHSDLPITGSARGERKHRPESIPAWRPFRDYMACPSSVTDYEVGEFFATREIPQCGLCPARKIPFYHQDPLHSCHPFWQKIFVCEHVQSIYGTSHVLQLDNDMVIRSDCPSPFDLVPPTDFAMVSGRQSPQRRVDRASRNQMAHEEWARRCDILPAPAWTHPNGGLYLYGTGTFGTMFAEIISHLLPTGGKHDLGCDECLVVNQLWTYHRSAIRFLPADYNVNLHQNDCWVSNPVMQSYIYHFVARAKERLSEARSKELILWSYLILGTNDPVTLLKAGEIIRPRLSY